MYPCNLYVCMVLLASLDGVPGTEPLRHDKASTEEGMYVCTCVCNVCMPVAWIDDGMYVSTGHMLLCLCGASGFPGDDTRY